MRYPLTPFSRPIVEFNSDHLLSFKDIYEGWYVDYKTECQVVKDTAKSLSSFANQFGGWLLIGVDEGNPKTMKAETFPGIPSSDVPEVLVKLREAASRHISPTLFFEHTVIDGPCDTLGLPVGKSVVVVGIPEGTNPPYVHSTGRIYRRIADSAEPTVETDRSVLDMLWSRSAEAKRRLHAFVGEPNTETGSLIESYIYYVSDLSFDVGDLGLAFTDFGRLLTGRVDGAAFNVDFDNIYPALDSYVARTIVGNGHLHPLPTFRWWKNGNARFTIPVGFCNLRNFNEAWCEEGDELLWRFVRASRHNTGTFPAIGDFSKWITALVVFTDRYHQIRDHLKITTPFHSKVRFRNVRNISPFVKLPTYVAAVEKFGPPVCEEDDILLPSSEFIPIDANNSQHPSIRSCISVLPLAIKALRALGIPLAYEDLKTDMHELLDAIVAGANKSA